MTSWVFGPQRTGVSFSVARGSILLSLYMGHEEPAQTQEGYGEIRVLGPQRLVEQGQ